MNGVEYMELYRDAYEEAYREGYEEGCREAREWYNEQLNRLIKKTIILEKVEDELRKNGWLVFDINPACDILQQIAVMLSKEGFSRKKENDGDFEYSTYSSDDKFFDIGIEIEDMIQEVQKQQKKILIGIDEISKTDEMIMFISEYGRWLRADYPVYLVCTGLYENIQELGNVQNLTFFRRAITIQTEPLQFNL